MSYCRSTSECEDGSISDVYLFGSFDGLELHVAYNRGPAYTVPLPKPGDGEAAWMAYLTDVIEWDHPEAGKAYRFTCYSDCIAKMKELKGNGVNVPQRAIDRLEREQAEDGDEYSV
jgi:hypothetical protein